MRVGRQSRFARIAIAILAGGLFVSFLTGLTAGAVIDTGHNPSSINPETASSTQGTSVVLNKTYNLSRFDRTTALVALPSGGYLIGGTVTTNNGDSDAVVLRVHEDGTLQNTRKFGGPGDDKLLDLTRTSDGGYAFVGRRGGLQDSQGWVLKVHPNGTVAYEDVFGKQGAYQEAANGIVALHDSRVAITGTTSVGVSQGTAALYRTYKPDGQIGHEQRYTGSDNMSGNDLARTPTGEFIIVATEGPLYDTSTVPKAWAIRIEPDGGLTWPNQLRNGSATAIVRASDGTYLIEGFGTQIGIGGEKSPWLRKIRPDGLLRWEKSVDISCSLYGDSVAATADGGAFLARNSCTDIVTPGFFNGIVEKRNGSGTETWNLTLGGANLSALTATAVVDNDTYAAAGHTNGSFWLVELSNTTQENGGTVSRIAFDYDDLGGNVNLEVNGDRRNPEDMKDLDGTTVGGATVSVPRPATEVSGMGTAVVTGSISSFSLGGQEFEVDNVRFGPAGDPLADVEFTSLSPVKSSYGVGDTFTSSPSGVSMHLEPYVFSGGDLYYQGSGYQTSGADPGFWPGNINLAFNISSVVGEGEPTIKDRTFTISPYPVKAGQRPIVGVNVTNAKHVYTKVMVNGRVEREEMQHQVGNRYDLGLWNLDQIQVGTISAGTQIKLAIIATNGSRRDVLNRTKQAFPKTHLPVNASKPGVDSDAVALVRPLHYYPVRSKLDVTVALARFANQDPASFGLDTRDAIRNWRFRLEYDLNSYFGSDYASMGAVGFDLTAFHNSTEYHSIKQRSYYASLSEDEARLQVVQDTADQLLTPDRFVVAHLGKPLGGAAVYSWTQGSDISAYLSMTNDPLATWAHEFGHLFLAQSDLYDDSVGGNIDGWLSRGLMGNGIRSPGRFPHPLTAFSRTRLNNGTIDLPWMLPAADPSHPWLGLQRVTLSDLWGTFRTFDVQAIQTKEISDTVPWIDLSALPTPFGADVNYLLYHHIDGTLLAYKVTTANADIKSLTGLRLPPDSRNTSVVAPLRGRLIFESSPASGQRSRQVTVRYDAPGPNLKTVMMSPTISTAAGVGGSTNPQAPPPDLDMRVVDSRGRVTGVTQDGKFVNQIPGAKASGDVVGGMEWISVPADVKIDVRVSSADVERYLNRTGLSEGEVGIEFQTTVERTGDNPTLAQKAGNVTMTNATAAVVGSRQMAPGETTSGIETALMASFGYRPDNPALNETVRFDGSLSVGLNTSITSYAWSFGDGSNATGQQVGHTYSQGGIYNVTLIVTGADGQTATVSRQVSVGQTNPVVVQQPAKDTDGDGQLEDVDGDGDFDIVDIQAFFVNLHSSPVQNNQNLFNFNGQGGVDIVDVQALFVELTTNIRYTP